MRTARRASILATLMLCLAGCETEQADATGVLVVPFELGNRKACEDVGVVSVRAELDDGLHSQEVSCDADEVRFNLLPAGRYDLVVRGLDEDDVAIMDSLAAGPVPVDVIGGGTTVVVDPAVMLTAAPAQLLLRWELGFGSCESAQLGGFTVSAWRADGSELLMESEVPCDMPGSGRDQYRLVPDAERELSGDAVGEVQVQALDINDIAMGEPLTFTFESPGAGGSIKLSLACAEGGCEGSGEAD